MKTSAPGNPEPAEPATNAAELRCGFTSGAALCAAVLGLLLERDEITLDLPFPTGGNAFRIPVRRFSASEASVIKDSGDDPDVSNGMELRILLRPFSGEEDGEDPHEHLLTLSPSLQLRIRGRRGVGVVTRSGLRAELGKYAINPGPLRMLRALLLDTPFATRSGTYLLLIDLPDGERLAERTLNPALGVLGGLSILGNTGLLTPYSHQAYAEGIRLQVRMLDAARTNEIAFVTGTRTGAYLRTAFPAADGNAGIPEIRIADYVGAAFRAARESRIARIHLVCMPGKLLKYAMLLENTHANRSSQSVTAFLLALPPERKAAFSEETFAALLRCAETSATLAEFASQIPETQVRTILDFASDCAWRFLDTLLNGEEKEGFEHKKLFLHVCDVQSGALLLLRDSAALPAEPAPR